jgi:hypothetical protein
MRGLIMAHYINKAALMAEIEKLVDKGKYHEDFDLAYRDGNNGALYALKAKIDTLEMKEVDLENYDKVKGLLSLSFMHFLDANRPEDKMCLSNGECFDIDKAFDELDFAKLFRYMEKYLKIQKGE